MIRLPTYDQLDELVDTDPIILRDVAHELVGKVRQARVRIEDLERALRLLRQHTAGCERCQQVADHDRDKAAENR